MFCVAGLALGPTGDSRAIGMDADAVRD